MISHFKSDRIKERILVYWAAIPAGWQIDGSQLHGYVQEFIECPRGTTMKYLNALKAAGIIDYRCLNRKNGIYEKIS